MSMSRVEAKLTNPRAPVSPRAVRSEEDEIRRKQNIPKNHRKKNAHDRNRKSNPQRDNTHEHHETAEENVLQRTPKQEPEELVGRIGQYPSKYSGIGDEKSDSEGESSIDEFELDILEDQVNEFERNVSKLFQLKDSLNLQVCLNLFVVTMMFAIHFLFGGNSVLPVPTKEAFTKLFSKEYRWNYYYGSALYNLTQVIAAPALGNPMRDYQIYNLSELWSS